MEKEDEEGMYVLANMTTGRKPLAVNPFAFDDEVISTIPLPGRANIHTVFL
jgi:hypothetical protein